MVASDIMRNGAVQPPRPLPPKGAAPAKYRHVAAIHSAQRASCLSHDSEASPSFLGFRNLMVIVLSEPLLELWWPLQGWSRAIKTADNSAVVMNLRLVIENFMKVKPSSRLLLIYLDGFAVWGIDLYTMPWLSQSRPHPRCDSLYSRPSPSFSSLRDRAAGCRPCERGHRSF